MADINMRFAFLSASAALLGIGLLSSPVQAETRKAFCHLNVKSPVIKKTQVAANCQFSQFQSNAYVVMYPGNRAPLEFDFPTAKQNLNYERTNRPGGIRFKTPYLTLKVFWNDPGTSHSF